MPTVFISGCDYLTMTQRLYYNDSYTTNFTTRIVDIVDFLGRPALVLDRTYFYPTGGGQPHDLGSIAGSDVVDVALGESGQILHVLTKDSPLGVGEEVACQIDWARRFDHMQHHTGQHILTQSFVERAGANTIGFHLSPNSVTIDLDRAISPDDTQAAEDVANQVVQGNCSVTGRVLDEAAARELGARIRRIPGHLATDGLRVVEVEDFDLTACGGTHVARTGEIGLIKVVKTEKYKEGSRIEFLCGGRALSDYRAKNEMALRLASDLTVGYWEIDQAVARLKADLKDTQSALKRANTALLEAEAPALLASAAEHEGIRVIVRAFETRDPGDVRALASRLAQQPGVLALLGTSGDKAQLIFARSAELPHDMAAALKQALSTLGSDRGGGRPEFAQGGGVAATHPQIEAALQAATHELIAAHSSTPRS